MSWPSFWTWLAQAAISGVMLILLIALLISVIYAARSDD